MRSRYASRSSPVRPAADFRAPAALPTTRPLDAAVVAHAASWNGMAAGFAAGAVATAAARPCRLDFGIVRTVNDTLTHSLAAATQPRTARTMTAPRISARMVSAPFTSGPRSPAQVPPLRARATPGDPAHRGAA